MNREFENDIVFARFINYMKKTLLNKRIDYLRHQTYLKKKEKLLNEKEWIVFSVNDDTVYSFFDFEQKEIKNAIKQLTEKQQKVLYLNLIKKMTLKQIGEKLNISTNAAEKIKIRAIKKLKDYLRRDEHET